MTGPLVVLMGPSIAGTLTRLSDGKLRFEYNEAYRALPDPTPLSVSMPTSIRAHSDAAIAPWLWGLLPENNAVLTRWAREFQVSAASPFQLLSTPIGHDCPGAVRFATEEAVDDLVARRGRVSWLSESDVAARLRDLKRDGTSWLGVAFAGQFSLAGAQAKTALLYRNGRWGVPSGATPTTHILKPAVAGLDDHDLNEHICLDAARRLGLAVARTRVERFGDETAIVVERYDRLERAGRIVRIHQEDVCQALSVPPSRKYQGDGGPGPRAIVALFRTAMAATVANGAIARFVDALAWNWLIAGTDAHAKNYSLLLDAEQVRLAPLYDIASALPYRMHEKKLRFAMKLGRDYQVYPRRAPWRQVAAELGIDGDSTVDRLRTLATSAPEALADAARAPEVARLRRDLPARLVDLVAERAARCLRLLG